VDEDAKAVVELELLLLQPVVRRDPARIMALVHQDFAEYGSSGRVRDRSSITDTVAEAVEPIQARDVRAHRLGPDAFLVTYRSEDAGRVALRSSTWLRHGGEWLLRFHQGTLLAEE
jgi:ribonuclease HI